MQESIGYKVCGVEFPAPYWSTPKALLYHGDVRGVNGQLRRLPSRSLHCCITSPPYWGLRDYGICECATFLSAYDSPTSSLNGGGNVGAKKPDPNCKKCSGTGRNISREVQIGAESLPDCGTHGAAQCGDCFVCSMVCVFREVRRVLRDDGTVWLNLGDTYFGGLTGGTNSLDGSARNKSRMFKRDNRVSTDLPSGNLVGVPWRVALALQADGWILRQNVIWYSPNKMPEPVTSRCVKSHEHIFLLTKSMDYYYDHVALMEPAKEPGKVISMGPKSMDRHKGLTTRSAGPEVLGMVNPEMVNKRDVWVVPSGGGYDGAHFATYSPRLITPCILAGTSEHGCCPDCGKQWERVVVRQGAGKIEGESGVERDRSFKASRNGVDSTLDGGIPQVKTVGWRRACSCRSDDVVVSPWVLDPFVGSGTTVATAIELGRAGVGVDVNKVYLDEHATVRITESLSGSAKVGASRRLTAPVSQGTAPPARRFRD